ncbi:unnamed protein product [Arctia plantaginis]|uniref:USP domain-containing protein n=1 Tax=Arctia plantaginis TaxID=874455 RepID=A0A8S0Z3U6_ARCPL|nr:unnamed protein product [Arctia plantaginis]
MADCFRWGCSRHLRMLKMPVNSVTESKKGVEKPKFSLSLNRNNATYLSRENKKPIENSKENSDPFKQSTSSNKENKPLKRPLKSLYSNTLLVAKRLKPLTESSKPTTESLYNPELIVLDQPLARPAMLNGHHTTDTQYAGTTQRKAPIATLSNLGNTCFLNSVLYTLRYAPRFLHNLHHLVADLASVEQKLGSIRLKSSSLGRSAAGLASSGTRSWSSKDLLSLGQSDTSAGKSKIQIATEKLHETYLNLRAAESKCLNSSSADASPEPFAADAFLAALRDVNSTFEGNRQQDAHELLVCILDNIRETCRALSARANRLQLHENGDSNGIGRPANLETETGKPTLGLRKSWKKRKEVKTTDKRASPTDDRPPTPPPVDKDERTRPGWDFVADDFEGTMVVRTMCLECEAVTEKAQAVCELCVPVTDDEEDEEPFKAACLSTEYLRDQNKYWCERCLRYNEARRSVAYSRLPRLLVLQLKRFSGGMEKITRHAPTPLFMPCFCEPCAKRPPDQSPTHRYVLWGVIMHLGQTLTGGHYVAYARAGGAGAGAEACGREAGAGEGAGGGSSFMRSLFNRPRPAPAGCAARDCCVPRARDPAAPAWLACDDDLVKPISDEEFEDLLSAEPKMRSAATPYLLFYVKSEVG